MTEAERAAKNRALAEALGWHNLEEHSWWIEDEYDDYRKHGFVGTRPDGSTEAILPDFFGSVDACLRVLPKRLSIHIDGTNADIYDVDNENTEDAWGHWRGRGATRAEALAEATLAWALRQGR